jgi:hypothetical protein
LSSDPIIASWIAAHAPKLAHLAAPIGAALVIAIAALWRWRRSSDLEA